MHKLKNTIAAPLLALVVFGLLLLSRYIDSSLLAVNENVYLSVIILQFIIFLLPAVIFCKLRGAGYVSRLRLRPIGLEQLLLTLCATLAMITGGMLLQLVIGSFAELPERFSLYDTFVADGGTGAGNTLYVILSFAVLPAFCEEFVFRGVLLAEYDGNGPAAAIITTSLLFAMLHFNLTQFPLYLLCGVLLALATYATRSLIGAVVIHFLYNLFGLYGQPYISRFYSSTVSAELFVIIIITVFILSLLIMFAEAGRMYSYYAARNKSSDYLPPRKQRRLPEALLSPTFLLCVIVFVIMIVGS